MDVIQFKVVSLASRADCDDVELQARAHPLFISPLFLHLPVGELSKFQIGQIYYLTGAEGHAKLLPVVETVPLSGIMDSHPTADDTWGEQDVYGERVE